MTQTRRQFLLATAGAALAVAQAPLVRASGYPTRPVRIVVGFASGGPMGMVAQLTAHWLSERLGQSFLVDNRPGAGGNIGTEAVVKAAPDGYTLLLCGPVNTINATLYDKLPFNFAADIVPVAGIARVPLVMVVNPSVPVQTVPEFIQYAKAHPGQINMASGGNGTPHHVAGELFKMMTGVEMQHVPYRGSGPALTDLIGGQVQVMFDPMPSAIEHVKSGRLRAIAVTSSARSAVLPDLPTVGEFVPEYEVNSWYGLGAPSRTPPEVVAILNREVNAALADASFRSKLEQLGGSELAGSSADFARLVANETDKWRKVIRAAHIKVD